jgi:hypothetical protein
MARPILTTNASAAADAERGRIQRAGRNVKLLLGLLAIYGPVALVLVTSRGALGKIYFVLAIWAIEGIVWYAAGAARGAVGQRRRERAPGSHVEPAGDSPRRSQAH